MTAFDPTKALDLLGKTVHLVEHIRHPDFSYDLPYEGRVIAVVVPLPGTSVATSLLLDLPGGSQYVDLDDCELLGAF